VLGREHPLQSSGGEEKQSGAAGWAEGGKEKALLEDRCVKPFEWAGTDEGWARVR